MKKDLTPWLLLPGIVLTLSGVTLLAPHQAAQAAPPTPQTPEVVAYDDGDGDELLEHWDNPLYSQEARWQMSGIAAGFLVLGAAAYRRRPRRKPLGEIVPLPSEADFLKLDSDVSRDTRPRDTRKAA